METWTRLQFITKINMLFLSLKLVKKLVPNFGKEKLYISAVLCIFVDGSKLPPLLIFHWKINGPKKQALIKNKLKDDIFVKCRINT